MHDHVCVVVRQIPMLTHCTRSRDRAKRHRRTPQSNKLMHVESLHAPEILTKDEARSSEALEVKPHPDRQVD